MAIDIWTTAIFPLTLLIKGKTLDETDDEEAPHVTFCWSVPGVVGCVIAAVPTNESLTHYINTSFYLAYYRSYSALFHKNGSANKQVGLIWKIKRKIINKSTQPDFATRKSVRRQRSNWTTYQRIVQALIDKEKVTFSFQKNIANWFQIEHQCTFEYCLFD